MSVRSSHPLDSEKVESIFMDWVETLVRNHGHRTVADVLSSPAIQAGFTGDIGQFAQWDDAEG